jgi:hypothetical protein
MSYISQTIGHGSQASLILVTAVSHVFRGTRLVSRRRPGLGLASFGVKGRLGKFSGRRTTWPSQPPLLTQRPRIVFPSPEQFLAIILILVTAVTGAAWHFSVGRET